MILRLLRNTHTDIFLLLYKNFHYNGLINNRFVKQSENVGDLKCNQLHDFKISVRQNI